MLCRRTIASVSFAAIAAMLGLLSCAGTGIALAWDHRSHQGLSGWTGTEELGLACPGSVSAVRLEVRTACRAGSLRVTLRDPSGAVRHDATLTSGTYSGVLSWPAAAGGWACEVRGDGFSGDYRVGLTAD